MKLACPYCLKQSVYIFHRIITRNQSKHINPVLKIKITIAGGFRQWRDFLVRESWKLVSRLCSSQGNHPPHPYSCPIPCPPGFLVIVFNLVSIKLSCQVLLCSARRAPWKAWALEPIKGWPPSRQGCHQGSRRSSHQRGGRLCQHHQRRRQPWGGWRWRVQVKDWQTVGAHMKGCFDVRWRRGQVGVWQRLEEAPRLREKRFFPHPPFIWFCCQPSSYQCCKDCSDFLFCAFIWLICSLILDIWRCTCSVVRHSYKQATAGGQRLKVLKKKLKNQFFVKLHIKYSLF